MKENEQVQTLGKLRNVYRSIYEFEQSFLKEHEICFNEAMLLCCLASDKLSSSEIAVALGLSNSNASKVIKSVEGKELVKRIMGESDKRQMYFTLTKKGKDRIQNIKCNEIEVPELLLDVLK